MVEPVTVNKALIIPNTGDLPGTWGSAALNPDLVSVDGMLGGFQTLSLTTGTTTLSVPAGFTAAPSAGPTQSQNALLTFSGTLSGNCTIVFPMPGFYIVENLCTVGAFYVKLQSTAPGRVICAPPGEAVHVFNDGVNVRYVNLGRIGSALNLTASTVPVWITNCTVPPYILADGSTYSSVTYPVLFSLLGTTTLPDTRGRVWANYNAGTGRLTTGVSGVNGDVLTSGGGEQSHILTALESAVLTYLSVASPHHHGYQPANTSDTSIASTGAGTSFPAGGIYPGAGNTNDAVVTIATASNAGGGAHNNTQPTYIGGITLIRAG